VKPAPGQRFVELLVDIVEGGERIPVILNDRTFDAFAQDQVCHLAIWKCVEVLGEASANILKLETDYAARFPRLPLRQAYAMRNQLTHGYATVDLSILWTTATQFVPPMVEEARAILGAHD
jgi:uncharacterized protein with HEPN domain